MVLGCLTCPLSEVFQFISSLSDLLNVLNHDSLHLGCVRGRGRGRGRGEGVREVREREREYDKIIGGTSVRMCFAEQ